MDVRCPRCGTEYEFDDALVSERGTTVKCTNCAHQFKIRSNTGAFVPERWVVRTSSGRELVYTSLRDLQRGIAQRQVGPEDLLSRGSQSARPLGSIAELEPFFGARAPTPAPKGQPPRTLAGVAPPANATVQAARAPSIPPGARGPLPPITPPPPAAAAPISEELPTLPRNARPDNRAEGDVPSTVPAPQHLYAPPSPAPAIPPAPVVREAPVQMTPTPPEVRAAYRDSLSSIAPPSLPQRRAGSRWIVGVVVLAAVGLLAGTVGKRFLLRQDAATTATTGAVDPRVGTLLEEGKRAIEDGDLEVAKEKLDKASALAEREPAVLVAIARLEVARADLLWIELRALDPKDDAKVQDTHRQLGRRVGRAQQAVEAALAVAKGDPVAQRAQVDALRLAADLKGARALVAPLAANASDPDNAFTLAALDMAESEPVWASVVERLRVAASAERGLGRARAALVMALARSGDAAQAQSELGKLETLARVPTLAAALAGFVKRVSSAPRDAGVDALVATVDPSKLPLLDTAPRAGEPEESDSDFRGQLKAAQNALAAGELDRAERLFNSVLAKHPDNTEAIAGLGDVAKQRRDPAKAGEMYDKVLKGNPTYLPALIGSADQKWDSGDRAGALALYKRVLEQAGPGSTYGQRAAARIAQGAGAAPAAAPEPRPAPSPPPSPSPSPAPKPTSDTPEIDTSDLPGFPK